MDLHGHKYNYVEKSYKSVNDNIKMFCDCGNVFLQLGVKHLQGHGCPQCSHKRRIIKQTSTTDKFVIKAIKGHGDKYDYSKVIYTRFNVPVCIICKKHGEFWTTPASHTNAMTGCPKCTQSKGECAIEKYLISRGIKYKSHKSFKDCRNKYPLIFDFYLYDYNTCIEFDGVQHFKPCLWFATSEESAHEKYKRTVKNDQIKNKYCCNQKINLIRIHYKKINKINTILDNLLVI